MLEIGRPGMAERTTLRLGGYALVELWPETEEDLARLPELAAKYGGVLYPLGRGSNVLACDGEIPLVLVRMDRFSQLQVVKDENGRAIVKAGAGVPLRRLLRFCLEEGLSGLEGLVGIPGNVGGAVAMNAGSFGTVIGTCLRSIEGVVEGKLQRFASDDLEMGYRHMSTKQMRQLPLVAYANLSLTHGIKNGIFRHMVLNFNEKKSRQPLTSWSAGCCFKNVAGQSAGKMLEAVGFRGKSLGGMAFSSKHANFLINMGNGTAAQALELVHMAMEAVWHRFGVRLDLEIRVVPCPW